MSPVAYPTCLYPCYIFLFGYHGWSTACFEAGKHNANMETRPGTSERPIRGTSRQRTVKRAPATFVKNSVEDKWKQACWIRIRKWNVVWKSVRKLFMREAHFFNPHTRNMWSKDTEERWGRVPHAGYVWSPMTPVGHIPRNIIGLFPLVPPVFVCML